MMHGYSVLSLLEMRGMRPQRCQSEICAANGIGGIMCFWRYILLMPVQLYEVVVMLDDQSLKREIIAIECICDISSRHDSDNIDIHFVLRQPFRIGQSSSTRTHPGLLTQPPSVPPVLSC